MTIKKQYLADKKTCKVTFIIDKLAAESVGAAALVGDFNEWDAAQAPMKRRKDGSLAATVKLPCGRSYQFRYLTDGSDWQNEWHADDYVPSGVGDSDNSVVTV